MRRAQKLRDIAFLDARGALVLACAAAFLPAMLPLGQTILSKEDAASFLQVLWQVEGALLALTITIALFVFQVFSSRTSSSLHDFAEETGLFPIFYAGLSSIALTGAVLLGYGHGGSAGWAGTWATSWSAVCAALLSLLFVMALRAIDVDQLRSKRMTRARRHVDAVVDRVILERISQHILKETCDEAGVEISWFGGDDGLRRPVTAKKSGRVHNINLRRLRRGGRDASSAQLLPPALAVKLGDWIGEETAWLFAQPVLLRIDAQSWECAHGARGLGNG
jgi:hypothetical protein